MSRRGSRGGSGLWKTAALRLKCVKHQLERALLRTVRVIDYQEDGRGARRQTTA